MFWSSIALVVLLWVLLSMKTSRPDGTYVGVHTFRRMMFYIMPTRNESIVYFDRAIRAEPLIAFLEEAKEYGGNMTHATVAAVNIALAENPKMNQFVVGRRMYQRTGRHITFSMKRQKLNKKAKLSAVKLQMQDGETFQELCARINGGIKVERSGVKTAADKEFDLLDMLPRPGLRFAAWFLKTLDYYNVLPRFFIEGDGMYTSVFIANLGSVGMGPGFHHLYEYGSCPLFIMVGAIEERAVVEDGKLVVGKVLPMRFSYDERIADGLTAKYGIESAVRVLSAPDAWLGDGAMFPHGKAIDDGESATEAAA